MNIWGRIAREPLVHFLVAGIVLFGAFALLVPAGPGDDGDAIVVDRDALLTHMQYRANAFEPEAFDAILDSMTDEELQALIDDYVTEEALYREARSLGLGESDYIIRQRMVQKMRFLVGDLAVAGAAIDEAALEDFFARNRDAYAVEPSVTFTHIFFDAARRGAAAEQDARDAIARLNAAGAGFNDAPGEGDRFPYLRNYVERTFDYVANHFGEGFAAGLSRLSASGSWQGPIQSAYGWHAVFVTERTERRLPALDEVRENVEMDFQREAANEALKTMIGDVRESYDVRVEDVRAGAAAQAE